MVRMRVGESRILLFGDENFSFCNGFLADHEEDIVEVCSCLKENELKQEIKNNIQSLNKNVVIHYGINPVQLKSKFPPNTFDVLYYILPGLSFHGYPDFIDPQTEMFKLRLNLFCFSFLKSSKNIIKPDGYVYLLFPEDGTKGNYNTTAVVSNNNENSNYNSLLSEGNNNSDDALNNKRTNLPFLPIEPKKLAKFCNVIRDNSKDYNLNLSVHANWLPVLFNMPIVGELPDWVKTCKYYCFKMTELPNGKNKNSKGNTGALPEQVSTENAANTQNGGDTNNGILNEDEKRQDDSVDGNMDEQHESGHNNSQKDEIKSGDITSDQNTQIQSLSEQMNEKEEEDPDEYNVLKIPPQVFDYPIEKLGHVNECFLFKLYSVNSKSVLISRLTLKYDPRISGWKGDNKIKKDMMNMNMNMNNMNMNGMNLNGMNMMKNMNNIMNMNKYKGGKYKNKPSKNDFQQQYKNNLMQNNMNYALNKKGNMNLPPPPPANLNIQPNNVNIPNQNMNYKQNNFPFLNNFKGMPNSMTQNVQNTLTNIPMNVNPNLSNNMLNPYINGGYNGNFRSNMYQQNIPLPPPMSGFNKKIYQGHNMNIKRKNDIYNCDNMEKSYDNYNMKENYKSDDDNNGNNMNACNDDYEYDQCDYNSGNVKNTHNKNAEDADYYFKDQGNRTNMALIEIIGVHKVTPLFSVSLFSSFNLFPALSAYSCEKKNSHFEKFCDAVINLRKWLRTSAQSLTLRYHGLA
ncbi:conserved Plasmodium protein, unknown function [Plasmodium ovale curtisi]|uniref:Uncharacterized protein n=1 Tax=Plasmodium ovale curtisi TaxID=864141 RepID=A0A1A8X332_PLAOA|nr:conserved Plasmodium protein, unknown function [Plasmodium ovale curtisi]